MAKRLQTGAGISNQGRDYKLGQERLQTGAGISNRCRAGIYFFTFSQKYF